jgi:hypothetical protein
MSLVPRSTARAIDRLARRAHAFHRFAHHPLCPAYAGELLQLGRRGRICRGCAYTGLGAATGWTLGLVVPAAPAAILLLVATSFALAGASLFRRLPKWASRFVSTLLGATGVSACAMSGSTPLRLLALGAVAGALGVLVAYRRRGPDRGPCATCPELGRAAVCSGYAAIVRREHAFQRVAQRWMLAARSR